MILGAGVYQLPLIQRAKEMGLYTIVVSYPGDYPGFSCSDRNIYLDTTDSEAIVRAAREEQIDGIVTTGTDVAVISLAAVCEDLRLRGVPLRAAQILTDKYRMKEAFRRAGIRSADFMAVRSEAEARAALCRLGLPAVLKVTDSSGSRGVLKLTSMDELPAAYAEARGITKRDYLLVEEYIDAVEIGIDAFVLSGEPVLLLPHDKMTYKGAQTTVPLGHHFPYSGGSETLDADIRDQVTRLIGETGLDNCALNIDAFVKDDKIILIEAGARAGATGIPELISIHCGFDYYERMILASLGLPVDFHARSDTQVSSALFFAEEDGVVTDIDKAAIADMKADGVDISLDVSIGDRVHAIRNGTDRFGQAVIRHASDAEYEEKLRNARNTVKIR